MDRKCSYLLFLDNNRLLYSFRENHRLSTQGATRYGGWESMDIRGHTTGHVLSALAQAYQSTGDNRYKAKADSLVAELKKCQDNAVAAGFNAGYLAAIPESYVNTLLSGGSIWAPLYNIHKTFAGLLDCYRLLNNATALDMATRLADWTYNKLSPYTHAQFQTFWNNRLSAAGEYGGYNESLADLYKITGTARYLTAAHFFDHDKLFNPCLSNRDSLNGLHANTSIPEIIGAMKIYEVSGDANSSTIARNFFTIVTSAHTYINGGNSQAEYFRAPNAIASLLTDDNNETCNIYNMLKLTRQLFFFDPLPKYMDYYERALYNQILASQDSSAQHANCTYFQPMRSGGIKTYQSDLNDFKCCDGTGLENHTKYGGSIFFYSGDTLWVNLFIPSQLNWTAKGITVRMDTRYPNSDTVRLTITGSGSMPVKLRVPFWLRRTMEVRINGTLQPGINTPGTYVAYNTSWSGSGTVELVMPQTLRFEKAPDNAAVGGVMYGAQLLAGQYGTNNLGSMPSLNGSSVVKTAGSSLLFSGTASTGTVSLVPYYRIHQRYSVYWNLTNVPSDTFFVATAPSAGAVSFMSDAPAVRIRGSQIRLEFSSPSAKVMPVTMQLFSMNGVQVTSINRAIRAGERSITLRLSDNLPNAIYVYNLTIGTQTYRNLLTGNR
ncbi:MAG: glycoside hydrolase family 127 protein [Chitinispirillaceae bacterium]|nr:glycoside hydrolase family 127 protein [Chitinispirillaceae bacterium]